MIHKVAQSTIDNIFGALGRPDDFNEGDVKNGNIKGQTEEELAGAKFFKPVVFEYAAIIILKDGKKEWNITSTRVIL